MGWVGLAVFGAAGLPVFILKLYFKENDMAKKKAKKVVKAKKKAKTVIKPKKASKPKAAARTEIAPAPKPKTASKPKVVKKPPIALLSPQQSKGLPKRVLGTFAAKINEIITRIKDK